MNSFLSQNKLLHAPMGYLLRTPLRLFLGLLFSACVGLLAYRRQSLTRSGVAGAIIAGTTTVGLGGWSWGLSLIFFFSSSSFFSHLRSQEKEHIAADKFSKGSRRDIAQAAANGGLASLIAACYGFTPSQSLRALLRAGYTGVLATANADTWATELGVLSPSQPRLITTGKPVAPGTSGAITALGTGAGALGALSLGIFFWLLSHLRCSKSLSSLVSRETSLIELPLIALISGTSGSAFDSLLGATVQASYTCPACHSETERRVHSCGTATTLSHGIPFFNNDIVNFLATLFGGLVAIVLHLGINRRIKQTER
jgi:uncharacterized protein (TIGR00297 family)